MKYKQKIGMILLSTLWGVSASVAQAPLAPEAAVESSFGFDHRDDYLTFENVAGQLYLSIRPANAPDAPTVARPLPHTIDMEGEEFWLSRGVTFNVTDLTARKHEVTVPVRSLVADILHRLERVDTLSTNPRYQERLKLVLGTQVLGPRNSVIDILISNEPLTVHKESLTSSLSISILPVIEELRQQFETGLGNIPPADLAVLLPYITRLEEAVRDVKLEVETGRALIYNGRTNDGTHFKVSVLPQDRTAVPNQVRYTLALDSHPESFKTLECFLTSVFTLRLTLVMSERDDLAFSGEGHTQLGTFEGLTETATRCLQYQRNSLRDDPYPTDLPR